MNYSVTVELNKKVQNGLRIIPDKVLYKMARITLDMSYVHIPMSKIPNHSGTLRRSTMNNAVRGSKGDYYLTSNINYAQRVWNFNDNTTNWTTPNTHSKWFEWTLKEYQKVIEDKSINQAWKEEM